MKAVVTSLFAITCFLLACCMGCQHDPYVDNVVPVNMNDTTTPTKSAWVVSYFMHNDTLMTKHLNGYTFQFRPNSVLEINTGAGIVSGSWKVLPDANHQQFIINMDGADDMLAMLNEEWEVETNTAATIQLKHDHTGHVMQLSFQPQ